MGITAGLVTAMATGFPSEEAGWVLKGLDPLICCDFTDASVITCGLLEATLRVTCVKGRGKKLTNKLELVRQK